MYIQTQFIELFFYFLEKSGGMLKEINSTYQPDYKGSWRGEAIWAFKKGDGLQFHGSCIKELNSLWSETLEEAYRDNLKNSDDSTP